MATRSLRRIQFGLETTAGTAVAATQYWRGTGTIEDRREIIFPEEDVGYLIGVDRSFTQSLLAAISFEETPATFELLPYIFTAGVQEDTEGTQDGTEGSGYIYTHTVGTNAAQTMSTMTIEGGDDQQAEEMEYGFVESFSISGEGGGPLNISADWLGRQVSKTTFTTNATLQDVEEIIFSKGVLYIDAVTGTYGTTEKSCTLIGLDLTYNTGLQPKRCAIGELYFGETVQTPSELTMDLTFEHNDTAVAEKDAWIAETPRLIQLKWEGSALTTSDTYSNLTFILNLVGKWESFAALDENDGNDVVTGTFRGRYNVTEGEDIQFIIVNENSTL